MKILSVLLSLVFFTGVASAQSDLEFDRDSVVKRNRPCLDGPGTTGIVVYNRSSETKTFDLLFLDATSASWFDSAGVPITNVHRLQGIILAANDSMSFKIKHGNGDGTHLDTLGIRTGQSIVDTLLFKITTESIVLDNFIISHDFGHVEVGDSVAFEHTVKNLSDIPFVVSAIEIDTFHWQIENITVGDTIKAGESRTIRIVYETTYPYGRFTDNVRVIGVCGAISAYLSVEVVSEGLHWVQYEVRDTVTGCNRGGTYTVKLHNSAEIDILMDSIVFDTASTGWSFVSQPPRNITVSPGEELECTVSRAVYGKNTKLNIFHSGGKRTWTMFTITNNVAIPVIKNSQDTVIFEIEEGEDIWFNALVENRGAREYQVKSIERVGSPLWTITTPDTASIIGTETLMIQTHFEGTDAPGEYSVTYTLRDVTCDSTLSQTLIARVGTLSVDEAQKTSDLHISPSIASREILIEKGSEFTYSIIDLLGQTHLSGKSITGIEIVRIDNLPQGRYFVRVESGKNVETRAISVTR